MTNFTAVMCLARNTKVQLQVKSKGNNADELRCYKEYKNGRLHHVKIRLWGPV